MEFLASAGLSVLIEFNQRTHQAGIGFAVVATTNAARLPMTAIGLNQVLLVHDSVPDAVEALCGASMNAEPDSAQ